MGSAVRVTSAAEGLPRRRFTAAEVEAMVTAGVPMPPKGSRHELVKIALVDCWIRARPTARRVAQEDHFSPQ